MVQTRRSFRKRGFTLVELMIVVAIIGVLAALAIYGVRRYLATAKTSEAKNSVGAMARNAVAAYERETVSSQLVDEGSSSGAASHALCLTSTDVPANGASVQGKKYQPDSTPGFDYETGDAATGWRCLKFSISSPQYYVYGYDKGTYPATDAMGGVNGGPNGFEAGAFGDLDGDGIRSMFALVGTVNAATGTIRLATQVAIANEFE